MKQDLVDALFAKPAAAAAPACTAAAAVPPGIEEDIIGDLMADFDAGGEVPHAPPVAEEASPAPPFGRTLCGHVGPKGGVRRRWAVAGNSRCRQHLLQTEAKATGPTFVDSHGSDQ